jgi:hypothetical protein
MNRLSRTDFADGLREQLAKGYDAVRIARWAFELHLDSREFEEGVESDLLQLIAMDMGEEFELTEEALQDLSQRKP